MRPLLAIELDDASHRSFDRMDRDEFVEQVFADASIPLVRVPARRQYGVGDLEGLLRPFLKLAEQKPAAGEASPAPGGEETTPAKSNPAQISQEKTTTKPTPPNGGIPTCPKCGLPMVVRTVSQGPHTGKQFYGCRNFPHCREVRPLQAQK